MTAIPTGMVAWHGGDAAPEDWDGGPVRLYDGTLQEGYSVNSIGWSDRTGALGNKVPPAVIAYTRTAHPVSRQDIVEPADDAARQREAVAPAIEWTPKDSVPGAYLVGHSKPEHPADGMTAQVCMGGGAYSIIPNPQAGHHGSIGWTMTWSDPKPVALTAVSIISSYQYLLSGSINMTEAMRRLRLLRQAWRALANGGHHD